MSLLLLFASTAIVSADAAADCAPYSKEASACEVCTEQLIASSTFTEETVGRAVDAKVCGGTCYLHHCANREVALKISRTDFAAPWTRPGLAAVVSRLGVGTAPEGCTARQAEAISLFAARWDSLSKDLRVAVLSMLGQIRTELPNSRKCAETLIEWYGNADATVRPILAAQTFKMYTELVGMSERQLAPVRRMTELHQWIELRELGTPDAARRPWQQRERNLLRLLPNTTLERLERCMRAQRGQPVRDPESLAHFLSQPWYEVRWFAPSEELELGANEKGNLAAIVAERHRRGKAAP